MRVYIVCDVSLDSDYGQSTHVLEMAGNLSKTNDMILFAPGGSSCDRKGLEVVYVPSVLPFLKTFFYQFNLFFYLFYNCVSNRPDVIYLRHFGLAFSPILVARILGIGLVVEVNGLIAEEIGRSRLSKIKEFFVSLSSRLNYKGANRIVAVTPGIKERLMEGYGIPAEKIAVVLNGANTDLFAPSDQKKARAALGLEENSMYICFTGGLAAWQGVECLIESVPAVVREFSAARFLIVGDGAVMQELKELSSRLGVSGNVLFVGRRPYSLMPDYINAADICVIPKKPLTSGYSPLKLYECMACGKPVVASRLPGFEILESSGSGLLFSSGDSGELGRALIKLLKDPKAREDMGRNAREYVVANHSWASVAEKVAGVCREAAGVK